MKKIIIGIFLFFLSLPSCFAFDSGAQCTILMDMDSHRILYSNQMNKVRSVASISKIMTGILAIESGKLKEKVEIGEEILKAYGSGIYIQVGEHITLEDLVYGLLLRSGNDAALAIAHYVGKDHFVDLMNEKAKEIGMKNTTFRNPSGLDQEDGGNLSSAYDMAILTSYAMKNEIYRKIVATKKYKLQTDKNTYLWRNKNKMLNIYPYATGGKTGYTELAKRTLVSTASKDNLNLVVVTLNDGNDWLDHKGLFEEAYETFKNIQILKKGVIEIEGETHYINQEFYIENAVSYPLKETELDSLVIKYELEEKRQYQDKDEVGNVVLLLDGEEVLKEPIYIRELPKESISPLERIKKWWKNLW